MSQLSYKPESCEELPFSDLHCHSCYSDGELTPEQLLKGASEAGVSVFAITDHDTVAGIGELRAAAGSVANAVQSVSGIEMTCQWGRNLVHIVGLGFAETDPVLGG